MKMSEIKRIAKKAGSRFFDPDYMSFFSSRACGDGVRCGNNVFFVTSEQFDYNSPRLYTIRILALDSGHIDTMGKYQQYETSKQAHDVIEKYCAGELK